MAYVLSICMGVLCCCAVGSSARTETRGTFHSVCKSPTLNAGQWLNPEGADSDGEYYAYTTATGALHDYYGFGFDIPQGGDVIVQGIVVQGDAWTTGTPITSRGLRVSLSWDRGSSWTLPKAHYIGSFEGTYRLGGPTDTWARVWSPHEINGDCLHVRVEALGTEPDESRLDWIRVTVHYAVDRSPPTLAIKEPLARTHFDLPIKLVYEAYDDVGLACCWCRQDQGDIRILDDCEDTVLEVDEGAHTLQVYVMDTSGKISSQSVDFSLRMRPAQPVLVLYDRSVQQNCYDHYLAEILKTEGIFGFQHADMSYYRQAYFPLEAYDLLVLLGTSELSPTEVQEIRDYVWNGGSILGIRPNVELAEIFGVTAVPGTLAEAYVGIDTLTSIGAGLVGAPIQYHSEADKYELAGAECVAWLYSDKEHKTRYPAVAHHDYGRGHSVVFSYPLARSVVLLHQGNDLLPDMTDADGDGKYRPQDYFAQGFYDSTNATIPQADEHQSLLVNAIYHLMSYKLPVPRLWYFPNNKRAITLISGDFGWVDGTGDSVLNYFSDIVRSYGARAHLNILGVDISVATYDSLTSSGHSLGPHAFFGDTPAMQEMKDGIEEDVREFRNKYGASGRVHVPHRNISVGYWEMARYFARHGLKMTGFNGAPINTPPFYGYMFGSALPFKIVKNEDDNAVIDAYYMPMVFSDMVIISYGEYSEVEACGISRRVLDDLVNSYHGVARMNFHPKNVHDNSGGFAEDWLRYTLEYCKLNGIPMWSSEQFYDYWVERSSTRFTDIDYSANKLTFTVAGAPDDATLMIPSTFAGSRVSSIEVDRGASEFRIEVIDGIEYALILVHGPDHTVEATYCHESER